MHEQGRNIRVLTDQRIDDPACLRADTGAV